MFRLFSLCFLLLAPGTAFADLKSHAIAIDGKQRSYHLYTPARLQPSPPLLVVLHGGGGKGRQIMRYTRLRFNQLAENEGFLVVYPDAAGGTWDFGEGTVSEALRTRHNDLKFLTTMIRRISTDAGVNRRRIFATGISRGGQASYFLACKRPGLIRAIAPVAMPIPDFLVDDCRRPGPIPILVINGTDDPIVPYNGGPIRLGRRDRGTVLSTDATLELFRAKNGCGSRVAKSVNGEVDILRFRGCGAPTVLFRVNSGGHTWPGARRSLPQRIVGTTNDDIAATDEIWNFFNQFD